MEAGLYEYTEEPLGGSVSQHHCLPALQYPFWHYQNIFQVIFSLLLLLFYILNSLLVIVATSLVFHVHSSSHVDFKPERFFFPFPILYPHLLATFLPSSCFLHLLAAAYSPPACPFLHPHVISWPVLGNFCSLYYTVS